jgi:hypothetical protein
VRDETFLLVTVGHGKENQGALELGDALYHKDPKVRPLTTSFPGVLLLYTSLNPFRAYRLLISQILSYPHKIYPLTKNTYTIEKLLQKNSEIEIRCEVRGNKEKCKKETAKIKKLAQKHRLIIRPKSPIIIHIQGINETIGYTILPQKCENYDIIIENQALRKKCIEHSKNLEIIIEK